MEKEEAEWETEEEWTDEGEEDEEDSEEESEDDDEVELEEEEPNEAEVEEAAAAEENEENAAAETRVPILPRGPGGSSSGGSDPESSGPGWIQLWPSDGGLHLRSVQRSLWLRLGLPRWIFLMAAAQTAGRVEEQVLMASDASASAVGHPLSGHQSSLLETKHGEGAFSLNSMLTTSVRRRRDGPDRKRHG